MSKKPQPRAAGDSAPLAHTIRVYGDTAAGPLIINVPHGRLTPEYVEQARAAGATHIRIHALDVDGRTVDRVVVR